MERYKTRLGVVLTEVCGEHLLVAAAPLREECPYVTVVNESSAFLWRQMEDWTSPEELAKAVQAEYEVEDPVALLPMIRSFLDQMLGMKYLLTEQEDEDE